MIPCLAGSYIFAIPSTSPSPRRPRSVAMITTHFTRARLGNELRGWPAPLAYAALLGAAAAKLTCIDHEWLSPHIHI